MARFRFRLQKLLDLRRAREKAAIQDLGAALSALEALERRLDELEAGRRAAFEALAGGVAVDGDDRIRTALLMRQIAGLEAGIAAGRAAVTRAEENVAAARVSLLRCKTDVKAFEQVREKAHAAWNDDERREEMRRLDEVSAGRFIRSRGGALK